jgi:hypothetical protein
MDNRSKAQSPRELVRAVFEAEASGDVATLVGLIDPGAMAEFKEHQLAQDLIFSEIATLHESPQDTGSVLQSVFRVRDRSEFEGLSPEEVVTRWFRHTTRQQARISLEHTSNTRRDREILGEVPEGELTVHVVFREVTPSLEASIPGLGSEPLIRVITTRLTPQGWRVRLNGGLVFEEGGGWSVGYGDADDESIPPGPM